MFGSIMGDFEDDPYFGPQMQHMQRMNNMMNSMFADPFGLMGGPPAIMAHPHHPQNSIAIPGMQMMPFGFPPMPSPMGNMGNLFSQLGNMNQNPNCHSFSSSSIMTMSSGPDGRPQVYQESSSMRTAPGGVKETKKSVSDSRTGMRKLAIGHHIGERAHILEREHNSYSGDQEERQEYINLEEEEADTFNREWESKTKRQMNAIGGPSYRSPNSYNRGHYDNRPLALPSTAPTPPASSQQTINHSRPIASPRRTIRPAHTSRPNITTSISRSTTETSSSNSNNNPITTATSSTATATTTSNNNRNYHDVRHPLSTTNTTTAATIPEVSIVDVTTTPSSSPQNLSRKREHSPENDDDYYYYNTDDNVDISISNSSSSNKKRHSSGPILHDRRD